MTSPEINLNKKILKMSDIELTNNASSELSAGFSTPPSSSLDTCDSGFNDLYSNSFTLISSASSKSSRTTPAQIDNSDSSPESAQLFDDNSATESQNTTPQNVTDHGPPLYGDVCGGGGGNPINEAQLDLNSLDYDHTTNACGTTTTATTSTVASTATTVANKNRFGDNDADDYNDDSNMSDISDLSDVFKLNSDIMPEMQRSIDWVHMQIASGVNPRECLSRIFVNSPKQTIPENITDNDLWRVIAAILSDPPRRQRLQDIQTIEEVCDTIKKSKNIIVLTGAGVSVSCGIPDFRSRDGIYERLRIEYPDMRDPQSMFDIGYFARDPRPFYQFAKEIYPGQFQPSLSHRFIKLLERKGKLLRNYTQNIDTLERVAGIENVIECHGSFATASCTRCKYMVEADEIQDDILHQRIPMCKICDTPKDGDHDDNDALLNPRPEQPFNYNQLVAAGVMKPDIVFFGESLPDKFHSTIELDKSHCDLLIVIGSSLKVRPVALIPSSINQSIPQILINREQLDHFVFDVELLGDSDVIINHMLHTLGEDWNDFCPQPALKQTNELILSPMNVHNIPPLLANAVIKRPQEPASDTMAASVNSTISAASVSSDDGPQTSDESCNEKSQSSQDSPELERSSESYLSMANFLPDNSFFYNEKNCYIFPGAEIWWNKDSDLESTSSDSSNDDDDDDDIEDMELSTIERNEMISDVETTIAVENLLENTNEHEFNKYLLKRNASTTLEHIHIGDSEIDDMNCSKRLKLNEQSTDTTASSIDHQPHHHHHHHHNHQHHIEHTSTMCDTTLDNSCSSSNTSDPSLPPQNEVFSPKL
ncbi:NAD-dependent protein deacetylase sirtuin-1 isoform X2 [Contarinia nasturtii]|nr:NAD-dependent protein deacetylase sirtuin-1 isoform X2 [Contarinia nasturtii]XP_031629194.1 NAD-dependent protein deacetylase sirtuin-1 isoform X2 [Contarinia nasturtii]